MNTESVSVNVSETNVSDSVQSNNKPNTQQMKAYKYQTAKKAQIVAEKRSAKAWAKANKAAQVVLKKLQEDSVLKAMVRSNAPEMTAEEKARLVAAMPIAACPSIPHAHPAGMKPSDTSKVMARKLAKAKQKAKAKTMDGIRGYDVVGKVTQADIDAATLGQAANSARIASEIARFESAVKGTGISSTRQSDTPKAKAKRIAKAQKEQNKVRNVAMDSAYETDKADVRRNPILKEQALSAKECEAAERLAKVEAEKRRELLAHIAKVNAKANVGTSCDPVKPKYSNPYYDSLEVGQKAFERRDWRRKDSERELFNKRFADVAYGVVSKHIQRSSLGLEDLRKELETEALSAIVCFLAEYTYSLGEPVTPEPKLEIEYLHTRKPEADELPEDVLYRFALSALPADVTREMGCYIHRQLDKRARRMTGRTELVDTAFFSEFITEGPDDFTEQSIDLAHTAFIRARCQAIREAILARMCRNGNAKRAGSAFLLFVDETERVLLQSVDQVSVKPVQTAKGKTASVEGIRLKLKRLSKFIGGFKGFLTAPKVVETPIQTRLSRVERLSTGRSLPWFAQVPCK